MEYQTASEVEHLRKLFSRPIPIVAACNRVQSRQQHAMGREWWKGVAAALSAVLVALAITWAAM